LDVENISLSTFLSDIENNSSSNVSLEKNSFNIIFSLANDQLLERFQTVIRAIDDLLKPSSYFILELKISNDIEEIRDILADVFESVNFLSPWSDLTTNPFSPFDIKKSNYCWIAALSKNSDYDPGKWMESI